MVFSAIPQVVTEDRASGALVVDGSLKFDNDKTQYLTRTPGSAGDRNVWTWSGWVKKSNATEQCAMFSAYGSGSNAGYGMLWFQNNGVLYFHNWDGQNNSAQTDATFRDTGWYHVVAVHDESASSKMKFYVNGTEQSLAYNLTTSTAINDTIEHRIGMEVYNSRKPYDGSMTQIYFIDGQALGPEEFGYTDPLTNTWRPKKYEGDYNVGPASGLNGVIWSNYITGTVDGTYPLSNCFGGNIGSGYTNGTRHTNPGTLTLSIASLNLNVTNVKLHTFIHSTPSTLTVNGTTVPRGSDPNGDVTFTVAVNGQLNAIAWSYDSGSGPYCYMKGIEVDLGDGAGYRLLTDGAGGPTGLNSFYLPLDGNSPIGKDQSGNGNDFTPKRFGGSVDLPKATGALPILNTDGGGKTARPGTRNDTYASNLVLALPLVDSKEDVHHIVKGSGSAKTITNTGATNTTVSNFYGGSFDFDGSNDRLDFDLATGGFGDGDFTLEYFFYQDTLTNYQTHFGVTRGTTGFNVGTQAAGNVVFYDSNGGGSVKIDTGSGGVVTGRWYHVAFVRSGSTITAYLDGVSFGTYTSSVNYSGTDCSLGSLENGGEYTNGKFSDFRIYVGVAKYTENFVVGSTAPDVLPDTPSGITGKTNLAKITDGAVALSRSPESHLILPTSNDLAPENGDFTIETFIYANSLDNYPVMWDTRVSGYADTNGFFLGINNTGRLYMYDNGNTRIFYDTLALKKWYHIALVRKNNDIKMYVDGIQRGTTYSRNHNFSNQLRFIGDSTSTEVQVWQFNGFFSNYRFTKGQALYDGNFDVPTEPLTATSQGATGSNVKLLACQSPTSVTAATVTPGLITTSGSPTATNFNPFTDDINTIRGQETGYATWNPLTKGSRVTLSNGNLDVTSTASSGQAATMEVVASIGTKSGKYYVEWTNISNRVAGLGNYNYGGTQLGVYSGGINNNLGGSVSGGSFSISTSDVVALAVDFDNKIAYVYKNGALKYTANYTTDVELFFKDLVNGSGSGGTSNANFGQKPFKYTPPDGFQPLSLSNVQPEKVIARPEQYVSATLFTGTGDNVSSRTVELPQDADLVWAKSRDRSSSHQLLDTVRGNNLVLQSNSANNDRNPITQYTGGGLSTIDGKTITIAAGTTNNQNLNVVNQRGVIWSWKAGGNKNTFNVDDVGYANASDVNMSVGALNNVLYDMSDVWSSRITGNIQFGSATNLFDGEITASVIPQDNGTLTWTPLSAITGTIRIRMEKSGNDLVINGVNVNAPTNPAGHWYTYSGNSITSIQWGRTDSASQIQLFAIEVNGKLLRDSNMPSVPSTAPTGCSVGTKQGFSIIRYNGNNANRTIAHGLSEPPKFWIYKNLTDSTNWAVNHTIFGSMRYLYLNLTNTQGDNSSSYWGNMPTSDLLYIGADNDTNGDGDDHIIYAWHDVPGLQKFGQWNNNNANDGAFIELGFKPALILLKNTDNVENWYWIDSARHPHNEAAPSNSAAGAVNTLNPDTNHDEATSRGGHTNTTVDILSNGFKIRTTNPGAGEISFGTRNYIYAAWAEAPSINLYGAQANAR